MSKGYRPPKNLRERFKQRCKNPNCRVELLDAIEKIEGFCHKCKISYERRKKTKDGKENRKTEPRTNAGEKEVNKLLTEQN